MAHRIEIHGDDDRTPPRDSEGESRLPALDPVKGAEPTPAGSLAGVTAIYDHAPFMMCLINERRHVLYANPAFTEFTGVSEADLRGGVALGVFGCYHATDDPRGCGHGAICEHCPMRRAIDDTFRTGEGHRDIEYDTTFVRDGMPQSVSLLGSTALIETETQKTLLFCLLDISSRKRMEEELKESNRKFQELADNSPGFIAYVNADTLRYEFANRMYMERFGKSREEIIGARVRDVIGEAGFAHALPYIETALRGTPSSYEFCFPLVTGARWVRVNFNPVRDEAGRVAYLVVLGLDVTEPKRLEVELRLAKERAEKSEALKDAFVANISHEIRTPLNIILGYSNLIADKFLPAVADGDRRYFDSVTRGGERLMRTVDMILDLSRLQSREYTLKPAELDLAALVRGIVADHQGLADEKQLKLSAFSDCENAILLADQYCISQAVSNLLHNAIKFTLNGSVELRVFLDKTGHLALSCRDTGIGISRDYLPHLFSRYSQEEAGYGRSFKGLGLGLALVKEYFSLNNATIAVESEKGVGTTFTITFLNEAIPTQPAHDAAAAEPAGAVPPVAAHDARPSGATTVS